LSARLVLVRAGLVSSVQDLGRWGWQHQGVSPAGAMDPECLELANLLVGNQPGTAALEMGLLGDELLVEADSVRIAFTGAAMPLQVDGAPVTLWRSHTLARGQRLAVGAATVGVWSYLAVAGGLAVPEVLGSRSAHWRSGLGGRLLRAGDVLPLVGAGTGITDGPELGLADPPAIGGAKQIRVILGPQADRFTATGLATFLEADWRILPESDRMAYRLDGPAVGHAAGFNILSDGIMRGSIQVPGTGRPLVMQADHQTTGGYPKIATVVSADLSALAQLAPGRSLRFVAITSAQARAARAARTMPAPVRLGAGQFQSEELLARNLISGVVDAFNRTHER
jgi:biotin-dependent carboxylase-like uncharacterized protein